MPTRLSQTDPERAELWAQRRQVVGQHVRKLRLEPGFTHDALALNSGVPRNVLIHVEQGKRGPLFERLHDFAEVLGVSGCHLPPVDATVLKRQTKSRNSGRDQHGAR
nr:helix-turn-helix transcriptional regulator [Mycobacterium syngnathidarum]